MEESLKMLNDLPKTDVTALTNLLTRNTIQTDRTANKSYEHRYQAGYHVVLASGQPRCSGGRSPQSDLLENMATQSPANEGNMDIYYRAARTVVSVCCPSESRASWHAQRAQQSIRSMDGTIPDPGVVLNFAVLAKESTLDQYY
ncbi:hypothetical protein PAAG_04484 [Paracoccidioides lutzii Pb01]|uniref:Uncharacterized protein n=1 Tax=Paracoccidioides lutzii (strain ATCC MYA-826 / Pb01) TaxID=502779 RepID=C1H140_PARBA|nr:hypothetical protein PAAG_04484 [Paracoccidioides lutzii Pb01]EEH33434.2 hypothetical protein PAAG_04484 [Paracoccidioides lutzii Pb01]